jgi:hypothetical protein
MANSASCVTILQYTIYQKKHITKMYKYIVTIQKTTTIG